jgi:hypothetical protein
MIVRKAGASLWADAGWMPVIFAALSPDFSKG